MDRVTAFAPATVANLGIGFDILGMAVTDLGDYVTVEKCSQPGVDVVAIEGDKGKLPRDAAQNTAAIAAQYVLSTLLAAHGIRLWLKKGLPLSSGLGSSAASAVAGAVAANALFGNPLSQEDLLPAVLEAEAAASGRHADNVAPALLGGIVLITGTSSASIHRLPAPDDVYLVLISPHIEVKTQDARAALPSSVTLQQMVQQTGGVAELVHALHIGNIHLFASAMQRDQIIEPAREPLLPQLSAVRVVAKQAGALATIISGSGPTLCSFCITLEDAEAVRENTAKVYQQLGVGCDCYITSLETQGARIVPQMPSVM